MASIFILYLAFALIMPALGHTEHMFTSPTGRQVPRSLIQRHFSNHIPGANLPSNVLYEIANKRIILGHNITLDFSPDVHRPSTPPSRSFPVFLNGEEKHRESSDVITIRKTGYTVVLAKTSRKVLVVYGRGVHLRPLHTDSYSDLLVNTKAFSPNLLDMSDDYEIPPSSDSDQVMETVGLTDEEVPPEEESVEFVNVGVLDKISARQTGSCASGTTHIVELAVAYDNTFCARFGNSESAATGIIEDIIAESNVAYGANTCIQLKIVHVEAHCNDRNDPYAGFSDFSILRSNPCTRADQQRGRACSPGSLILRRFRDFWSRNRGSVARDAAIFFPGFQDGTGVAGVAALGSACSNRFGYGWVENANAFVAAHEIGHILGGRHTTSGLMGAVLTRSTPFSFSATSVQQFTNYLDNNPSSSCITAGEVADTPTPSVPSSTPAPSPSPDVPTPTRTCRSSFSRSMALACRRITLGTFNFRSRTGPRIGRLVVRFEQRLGQIRLLFSVSRGATILALRGIITTVRPSSPINLGSFRRLRAGSRFAVISAGANALPIPSSASSCCRQTVFAVYDAIICARVNNRTLCVRSVRSYSQSIRCTNSCRGLPATALFTPMSRANACPTCE